MLQLIKDWFSSSASVPEDGILSRTAMDRAVTCEKSRSDRTNIPFSLLRISAAFRTPRGRRLFGSIVEFSKNRLRITDQIGWLDGHTLAVLLPITGADGAHVVAQEYIDRFGSQIDLQTHTYPAHWMSDDFDSEHADDSERHETATRSVGHGGDVFARSLPIWKRTIDIVASGMGLLVLSPLLLVIGVLIKATSPGNVLYHQMRTGRGGRPFRIHKFRSMISDADLVKHQLAALNEQDGPAFKIKNDPRVTSIGRFLRKTSLDELPQLWNVFCGDMTLVGPRPLPCGESDQCLPWQKRRLEITPGLTCIWQVYGRSRVTFEEWMRMDLRYMRQATMLLDMRLIWMTAWMTFVKKNGM